jgi:hypothetical protein
LKIVAVFIEAAAIIVIDGANRSIVIEKGIVMYLAFVLPK